MACLWECCGIRKTVQKLTVYTLCGTLPEITLLLDFFPSFVVLPLPPSWFLLGALSKYIICSRIHVIGSTLGNLSGHILWHILWPTYLLSASRGCRPLRNHLDCKSSYTFSLPPFCTHLALPHWPQDGPAVLLSANY